MPRTHSRLRLLALLGAALVASCRPAAVDGTRADAPRLAFPAEWRFPAGSLQATFAPRAMVTSNSELAAQAGVEIMRQGGNAVDAAVAVGFAMAVTYPEAGNLGGGGYMVIRLADGREAAIDYREVAPLTASRDMYLDAQGKLTDRSVVGYLASGVPGAVAGMSEALAKYGTMSLSQVLAPAIRLARDGFVVDSTLARSLAGSADLITQFEGAKVFFPGGRPLAVGTRLRQPALARTLEAIASGGSAAFYKGWPADSIAAAMRRGGGNITTADLASYQPKWRTPVRTSFRGHTLISMPPSSSGGVTIAETLNILDALGPLPPHGSTAWTHLLASAYQRAFVDRNEKLADPDVVQVPVERLTSKAYARRLAATIDHERATPTPELAREMAEATETTHYSVVDAKGNAVATTTTINSLYGSGVYIPGTGIFMNNEMDDFAAQPGKPNQFGLVQGEANAVAPGKRMLSAMSPTIVLDGRDQVKMVVGSRGGPRIITGTSQIILNVLVHRMSLADAFAAPRLHHQALPDRITFETNGLFPAVQDSLRRMGHSLGTGSNGLPNAIVRVNGGWQGMVDPRGDGGAVGY
ncbi:MAG TPA: gamma-glutamyltransferase [Gemmatimonadaceae bacterium]|nr:gamma-glutamyltransferase [Gemmatimonadaceae bacterium]